MTPEGYKCVNLPREGKGGGVALIYKSSLGIKKGSVSTFKSFECLQITVTSCEVVHLAIIYRPPPSKVNGLTTKMFNEEFPVFLGNNINTKNLVVVGDLNVHWDKQEDKNTKQLSDTFDEMDLTMHVSSSTHPRTREVIFWTTLFPGKMRAFFSQMM